MRRGGKEARRQPQHALRPVDAGAQDAARPRRARRAGRRRDRDERPAALAGVHQAVRADRAPQHVDPPPGRVPVPVRRSGADPGQRPAGPEPRLRARGRDGVLRPRVRERPAGDRPRQLLHVGRPPDRLACRGHRRRRQGDDRLARLPGRQRLDDRLDDAGDGRRLGAAALGGAMVPAGVQGNDGPAHAGDPGGHGAGDLRPHDARDDGARRGGVPIGGRGPCCRDRPRWSLGDAAPVPARRAGGRRHRRGRRAGHEHLPGPRRGRRGGGRRRQARRPARGRRATRSSRQVGRRSRSRPTSPTAPPSRQWRRASRASSEESTCSSTTPRSTRVAPGTRSPRRSGMPSRRRT